MFDVSQPESQERRAHDRLDGKGESARHVSDSIALGARAIIESWEEGLVGMGRRDEMSA
jgi:hypothetical protein